MASIKLFFLIVLFSLCGIQKIQAEETDQFTLPPGELQDIGPATSRRLFEVLENVMAQTNAEIQMLRSRASQSKHAASELALRRRDTYLADLFYKKTGPGYPRWMRGVSSPNQIKPTEFKQKWPWKTSYWLVFSLSPLFVIGLAPTINMHGYYFGTDKLGHFFMQGHTYYKIYKFYQAHGKSAEQAHAAINLYGQILEQTYLGTLINGVYSNADLSGNYAGWKFYMNLGHSVKIGERTLPPLLVLHGDKWEFAKHVNKNTLLKPYLSDNLNEALNPCRYSFSRGRIRQNISKQCGNWIERTGITKQIVEAKLAETSRWHGETYGHWLPANDAVTLNTCFEGK